MRHDMFHLLADTFHLAATLRLPRRAAGSERRTEENRPAANADSTQAPLGHPLLGGLLDLEVVRRATGSSPLSRGCE